MKTILYNLLALLTIVGMASCTKVIDVDLNEANPQIVIEGEVSDQPETYWVKVSRTGNYIGREETPKVSGAVVTITDNNQTYTLQENPNEPGTYETSAFVGVPGTTYFLKVVVEGKEYTSQSTMPSELLDFELRQTAYFAGDVTKDPGYYLQLFTTDPPNEDNYYQWRFTINDTIKNKPDDIAVASDEWIQEQINGFQAPYTFQAEDRVKFAMLAIPKETYEFYDALATLLFNDGGMFDPPPANPPGNINGGIGIFSAVSIKSKDIVIVEKK
ncbi:hypothetical protein BKI52_00455 [marine bacterium AO1-C]|nr:hypothetical protein BKI52_00455 [marine bacterium AO1-C]